MRNLLPLFLAAAACLLAPATAGARPIYSNVDPAGIGYHISVRWTKANAHFTVTLDTRASAAFNDSVKYPPRIWRSEGQPPDITVHVYRTPDKRVRLEFTVPRTGLESSSLLVDSRPLQPKEILLNFMGYEFDLSDFTGKHR